MLKEKVYVNVKKNALQALVKLLNDGEEAFQHTEEKLFQLLKGEAKVFRYSQNTEGITYLSILFLHEESNKTIQLLIKMEEQLTIIDSLIDVQVKGLEEYLPVHLELTTHEADLLSPEFWQAFYQLKIEPERELVLTRLKSWQLYTDYLISQKNIPYTIKTAKKLQRNQFELSFFEEANMQEIAIQKDDSLLFTYAFSEKELAKIVSWNAHENKMIVTSKEDLLQALNDEVKIYNLEAYDALLITNYEVKEILQNEIVEPSIHHPLLNPLFSTNSKRDFFGYSAKQDDTGDAIEQLLTIAETNFEHIAIISENDALESNIIETYKRILPVDQAREKEVAMQTIKSPMLEKSTIKLAEIENMLSAEEVAVQKRAIGQYSNQVNTVAARVNQIEATQRHLSEESTKNTNKMTAFLNLITSYQEEQEQLAFRNDQLIKMKGDLESSIKEQQQILKEIAEKQEEDHSYYEKLEKNWLQFNQESTVYTDHIVNLKNIGKAENVIEDCQGKVAKIQFTLEEGKKLKAEMDEEYAQFKLNQQVEKVDIVIKKIKSTADFVGKPLDLQFASSYAELTDIYMDKYMELEILEERFNDEVALIQEELQLTQITATKPAMSHYNYDRHFAEEKMTKVLDLFEKKPIALGINYKAKQRWKESLVEAVEDLYSMQVAMTNEKQVLENKLMAQLEYSEQLIQYFDNDIQILSSLLDEQQQVLRANEEEYDEIIQTAILDIEEMQKKVQIGLDSTKGRSENFSTLEKLEKTRKEYKVELLAKYEALEVQANEIEEAEKYIRILEAKHSGKVDEVLKDKEEMNIQIDVLQHDIVNSKETIEKLKQENTLINLQYEALVEQILICQNEHDQLEAKIATVQNHINMKQATTQQNRKTVATLKKWHEQLQLKQHNQAWKNIVEEKSKLRFYNSFEQYIPLANEVVIFEDEQYSWIDVVTKLKDYPSALFITTNIAQRNPMLLEQFEQHLFTQAIGTQEKQQIIESLKVNPFSAHAQRFEKIETPYLIQNQQKKVLM